MAHFFEKLNNALEKIRNYREKDLATIRKEKAEILQLKAEIESMVRGRYVRNDERIIISAPEIIIGNVDEEGVLRSDMPYSHVVIRSNNIDIEGTSPAGSVGGGTITQRASVISTIAVDPGVDGLEEVVGENSAIIQQARSISLNSNDSKDVFTYKPSSPIAGIALNSDTKVAINATPSRIRQLENINSEKTSLSLVKESLSQKIADINRVVNTNLEELKTKVENIEGLTADEWKTAVSVGDLYKGNKELTKAKNELRTALNDQITLYAKLIEVERKIKKLEAKASALSDVNADTNFKSNSTGGHVSINGEIISMTSTDGDGNLRTNNEASIEMQAKTVKILSMNEQNALMEDGQLYVNTNTIKLSAADHKQQEGATISRASGTVEVLAKMVNIGGMDYKKAGNNLELIPPENNQVQQQGREPQQGQEQQPVQEQQQQKPVAGEMNVMMENVRFLSADYKGNCNGKFSVNSKSIHLKSMNVTNDKTFADSTVADESWTQIFSKNISIGAEIVTDKNNNSTVQNKSAETNVTGTKIILSSGNILGLALDNHETMNIVNNQGGVVVDVLGTISSDELTVRETGSFGEATGDNATFKSIKATEKITSPTLGDGEEKPGRQKPSKKEGTQHVVKGENGIDGKNGTKMTDISGKQS